jgi:hypothetical protein
LIIDLWDDPMGEGEVAGVSRLEEKVGMIAGRKDSVHEPLVGDRQAVGDAKK